MTGPEIDPRDRRVRVRAVTGYVLVTAMAFIKLETT